MTSNEKRYGVQHATDWGGSDTFGEEPEGDYVTHAHYVARESELVGRAKWLRSQLWLIATAHPLASTAASLCELATWALQDEDEKWSMFDDVVANK